MSWTVACFCGYLFHTPPAGRCPLCGTPVPVEIAEPHPDRRRVGAVIRSPRRLEPWV
jgi:hypothetical protein